MNEVSSFCNGECNNVTPTINTFPYLPGGSNLNNKTIDLGGQHYNFSNDPNMIEYNVHSLHGFMQSISTNKYFLKTKATRPFIITRSTFVGHGAYASHWLGDNHASFEYLQYSIQGVMNT